MQRTILHYFVVVCALKKRKWIRSVIQVLSQSLPTGGGECRQYKPFQNIIHYLTGAHFQRLVLPAIKRHVLLIYQIILCSTGIKIYCKYQSRDTTPFPYLLNMKWIWNMTSKNELNQYYMHNKYYTACAAIAVLLRVRRPRLPIHCSLNNSVGVLHVQ